MKNRLACAAVVAAIVCTTSASAQTVPATWEVKKLVPGSAFHGVHGLGVDKAGHLFAGSVAGAMLYEVDIAGGTAKVAIPSPVGMADDIAFAPDGTMAWTAFLMGDLYARKGDEERGDGGLQCGAAGASQPALRPQQPRRAVSAQGRPAKRAR